LNWLLKHRSTVASTRGGGLGRSRGHLVFKCGSTETSSCGSQIPNLKTESDVCDFFPAAGINGRLPASYRVTMYTCPPFSPIPARSAAPCKKMQGLAMFFTDGRENHKWHKEHQENVRFVSWVPFVANSAFRTPHSAFARPPSRPEPMHLCALASLRSIPFRALGVLAVPAPKSEPRVLGASEVISVRMPHPRPPSSKAAYPKQSGTARNVSAANGATGPVLAGFCARRPFSMFQAAVGERGLPAQHGAIKRNISTFPFALLASSRFPIRNPQSAIRNPHPTRPTEVDQAS
jgi:hypothetical protein